MNILYMNIIKELFWQLFTSTYQNHSNCAIYKDVLSMKKGIWGGISNLVQSIYKELWLRKDTKIYY